MTVTTRLSSLPTLIPSTSTTVSGTVASVLGSSQEMTENGPVMEEQISTSGDALSLSGVSAELGTGGSGVGDSAGAVVAPSNTASSSGGDTGTAQGSSSNGDGSGFFSDDSSFSAAAGGTNATNHNDALPLLASQVGRKLKDFLPFFVILNAKLLHDHSVGLLVLIGLTGTFLYANDLLKDCISQRERSTRTLMRLGWLMLFLSASVVFMFYVFEDQSLYRSLYMFPPTLVNFDIWNLMWCVLIGDYVVKYLTMCIKGIVAALPRTCLATGRRGSYYLLIEHISQCYRLLPPIPCWIMFLTDNQAASGRMDYYNGILVVLYVIFKAVASWQSIQGLSDAWRKFRVNTVYGSVPTRDQIEAVGSLCPICHEDVCGPVRLDCSHVFCEDCVAMWFDRKRTCPICRTKVVADPAWRDGSTAMYLQVC